jgi:hypothetical protein
MPYVKKIENPKKFKNSKNSKKLNLVVSQINFMA